METVFVDNIDDLVVSADIHAFVNGEVEFFLSLRVDDTGWLINCQPAGQSFQLIGMGRSTGVDNLCIEISPISF